MDIFAPVKTDNIFLMFRFFWLAGVAVVFTSFNSYSQSREEVTQATEWFSTGSNIKIHKRMTVMVEGNYRFVQSLDPMQFQIRTGLDFTINKHLTVMPFGFVYTWNPIYGKQPAQYSNNEYRFFEQVAYKHTFGRVNMSHRVRLEQRHAQVHALENGDVVYEGYDNHTNRIRYRLMLQIPISNMKIEPKTLFANMFYEGFQSWGGSITFHEPDQHRFFGGIGYQVNSQFNFYAGPLYQLLIKSNGTKQENNIGGLLHFTYNLDLTKKE